MRQRVLLSLLAVPFVGVGLLASGFGPAAIAVGYLAAVTPWLVWVDLREHRLPNVLVLPGIGAGLVACAGEWMASGRFPLVPLVAGATYAGFLLLMNIVGGMGMGDVKLGAALGLASWNLSLAVLSPVIAFLVGGLVSVVLLIAGRRGQRIAFGPFLLGGFWVAVLLVALSRR
jgi:leader peptidase (prepilin peptidase)/N-methyltransferase